MYFLLAIALSASVSAEFFEPDATSSYTTCEQSFSNQKFSIILPKKLQPQPFECKFHVSAFAPDVCRLRLNFKKFILASSASCNDEFIKIGYRRLCGSILGYQEISFSETSTVIRYRGNGEHDLDLEIEQIRCESPTARQDCEVVTSDTNTEISSPAYPQPYPTPIFCSYNIKPSSNSCQTLIRFHDFNIPESTNCLKGRLLIDGKSYCGTKTGWQILSNATNNINFEFSAANGQNSGNFRVAIQQIPCSSNLSETQLAPTFPPDCCSRIYNAPNFILASPGFLKISQTNTQNCVYQIAPASSTTCRLKFIFLHFWLGQEDIYYGCTDGFLEIDGRRICGCKDGLVIDSYFNGVKTLRLNTRGLQNKGFLIEVQQEDCNYNYRGRSVPEETTRAPDTEVEVFTVNKTIEKVKSRFLVASDDSRCFQWGLPHWLDKVKLILQTVVDQCPVNNYPPIPPIIPPWQNPPIVPDQPQIPTPPIIPPWQNPPIVPPPQIPTPPIIPPWQNPPIVPPPQFPIQPPSFPPIFNCRIFSTHQGGIQSPGYPWSYPPNQKCCFRFRQIPGFCSLQLTVLDFDILWSPKCLQDYLLIDHRARYCSKSLQSAALSLPFRNGFASIDFLSDAFFSTRGFRAVFRQIPCYAQNRADENCRKYLPPVTEKPYPPGVTLQPTTKQFELGVTPV